MTSRGKLYDRRGLVRLVPHSGRELHILLAICLAYSTLSTRKATAESLTESFSQPFTISSFLDLQEGKTSQKEPTFVVQPFDRSLGTLDSVNIKWLTNGSFQGVTGPRGGSASFSTGSILSVGSYEYGQTGKGNGSGGGPNEALRFELNPDASDHTFVRPKNGALPSNQSIWELLSGVNPFSISSNGTSRFTWSGISQGYADFLTLARVTFNYRRVSEEIQKVKQAFVESIRFTDFEPSAESTRVSLGASMFTVQPFDHTLGILRSINIAWEASGHFEGSTGDSRGGFAEISSSGSSKVGGHRYNDTGSGTGLGAGPNSHLSLTLGPVMSEYHFEEPSAGQAYDREIWNILTGDSPYTISHLENQLWYSGIETGGATFPATAVVTYNYLPYLTPKPVLNDVPGPAGLLGVCSFLHVTRRIRNRKNQLQ